MEASFNEQLFWSTWTLVALGTELAHAILFSVSAQGDMAIVGERAAIGGANSYGLIEPFLLFLIHIHLRAASPQHREETQLLAKRGTNVASSRYSLRKSSTTA